MPRDLRDIRVPVLLLDGARSPAIMRVLNDRLHELIPHAERVEIPDASHDAHMDNPGAVTEAIRSFHGRVSPSDPADTQEPRGAGRAPLEPGFD